MQVVDGPLRVRRGLEDRSHVFSQNLQPGRHVGRVVLADLRRQLEVGAQEGRTWGLCRVPFLVGRYVAGETDSIDFPSIGAFQPANRCLWN